MTSFSATTSLGTPRSKEDTTNCKRREILRCEFINLSSGDATREEAGVLPKRARRMPKTRWAWLRMLARVAGSAALLTSISLQLYANGGFRNEFGLLVYEKELSQRPRWIEVAGFGALLLASLLQLWRGIAMYRIFVCLLALAEGIGFAGLIVCDLSLGIENYWAGNELPKFSYRSLHLATFYFSIVLSIAYLLAPILYKSVAGLFAPAFPSIHSPTVLPMFLVKALAAISLSVALGLLEFGHRTHENVGSTIQTTAILRLISYGLLTLSALGELNIIWVAVSANKRRIHRKELQQNRLLRGKVNV